MSIANLPFDVSPFREFRAYFRTRFHLSLRYFLSKLTPPGWFQAWERRQIYKFLKRSRCFDPSWYLSAYPDLALSGAADPLRHYIDTGADELRDPSARFDTVEYLQDHRDALDAGINPLYHYLVYGRWRGHRKASKPKPRKGLSPTFDREASERWLASLSSSRSERLLAVAPLVSVVMAVRNRAGLVSNAIRSVLAQTYPHWELWVIDDGSTDGTAAAVQSFTDPRIHLRQTAPQGVSPARNLGLERARGEYVAYLDSDNAWTPGFLLLMLRELDRSGNDCAYCAVEFVEPAENGETTSRYLCKPFDYATLNVGNFIDLNGFMHRRSLFDKLGGFDPSLKRMVDWDLVLRYAKGRAVSFAPFLGVVYNNAPSPDRISIKESYGWLYVVRNKHWVDWSAQETRCQERAADLVSIVICVYGQIRLTEACVASLYEHPAGMDFEVVLVDNGSDPLTAHKLEALAGQYPAVRVIYNPDNCQFALGNNLGFAATRGARVVFLNNDTEVTPEWLRTLVAPLDDPDIKGAGPKLLYPDGSIAGAGLVFSRQSPIAYPIYLHQPGDFEPTLKSRGYPALTAACIALRARDFIAARGFDPLFINGQEDTDLCLRLGGGHPVFRYVADSIVFHHEGKTPGRGKYIEKNRETFKERWNGRVPESDLLYYKQDGMEPEFYVVDNPDWAPLGNAMWRPKLAGLDWRPKAADLHLERRVVAIKIPCPRPAMKDHWGDYHFAVALAAAFARRGVRARIDFLESWESAARVGDINLVLRGLSRFKPRGDTLNFLWVISHPELISEDELKSYDHVFAASRPWAERFAQREGISIGALLQCTDSSRFRPLCFDPRRHTQALFVANSRKKVRPVVEHAKTTAMEALDIYGQHWEGLAPEDWIKGEKIANQDLPAYYSSADVVLNDHWEEMRREGFVSNRVFDVLACGAPLVTDSVSGLPEELAAGCHFFDQGLSLGRVIARARRHAGEISSKAMRLAEYVREHHSFDQRAGQILAVMQAHLERQALRLKMKKEWKALLTFILPTFFNDLWVF